VVSLSMAGFVWFANPEERGTMNVAGLGLTLLGRGGMGFRRSLAQAEERVRRGGAGCKL